MRVEPTEHARWKDCLRTRNGEPPKELLDYCLTLTVGMTREELAALYRLGHDLQMGSVVVHVGVWRGASLCAVLAGANDSRHIGIDCFDLPGVSRYSANPPADMEQTAAHISPLIRVGQSVSLDRANTLELRELPRAHLYVIDAGHSAECITHDLALARAALEPGGVIAVHDYGQLPWPAVREAVDAAFPGQAFETVGTLAIIQPI